jgi:hypothetical protein
VLHNRECARGGTSIKRNGLDLKVRKEVCETLVCIVPGVLREPDNTKSCREEYVRMLSPKRKGARVRALTDVRHGVLPRLKLLYSIEISGCESFEVCPDARQQQLVGMVFDATIIELGIGFL